MDKRIFGIAGVLAVVVLVGGTVAGLYLYYPGSTSNQPPSTIPVVAGENFWGSLISQLGGVHIQVTSVVSDPNADPHEYESSAANARAIADAKLVIVNGAGYDDWAIHLIAASNSLGQKVLNVADLLGKHQGDNPHFWYSPSYVNRTVHAMYLDLVSIDSVDTTYYQQQYSRLNASLAEYNSRITKIRQQFHDVLVASTESIFEYLAEATRLKLISPPEFMEAVAEGIEPSDQSKVQFYQQIVNATMAGNATVLVYNQQTVTPLTQEIKVRAQAGGLQVVGVTETIQPPDVSFEVWMNAELISLYNALNAHSLGQ